MTQNNQPSQYELIAVMDSIKRDWEHHIEVIELQSKLMKATYDSLMEAGFDKMQALHLCAAKMKGQS